MKVTAVVPTAGVGKRLSIRRGVRKPFLILNNKPILIHTLSRLERSGLIDNIIAVVYKYDIAKWRALIKRYGLKRVSSVVAGGQTRYESVRNGLSLVEEDSDIVLIHDGVRPLVTKRMISDSIRACRRFGAAVCGVPATSTVKSITNDLMVRATPDRRNLYIAQTPQVFKRALILKAYKGRLSPTVCEMVTDDSVLVERLGHKVKVVPGSYRNIKITTPEDLMVAERLMAGTGPFLHRSFFKEEGTCPRMKRGVT